MTNQPLNIVAILAGGTGSRMGADKPKQFLPLGEMMVIEHTIVAFERHEAIDAIIIVVHSDWLDFLNELVAKHHWHKVRAVVVGGKERYHSTLAAIEAASLIDADCRLLIHDAARPLVSHRIIGDVVMALNDYRAVAVGLPSTDTIWKVSLHEGLLPTVDQVPMRNLMYRAQTPQAFHLSLLREAYQRVLSSENYQPTDDCGVLRRAFPNEPVAVVVGEERNLKITTPEDLKWAKMLLL
ncbi:MAG: 2-C-methyl-D-erythritol 4-phosphate cytidylyltransferase [Bacteroidales bacterium]|nr:2-C-methyl-D-erythritol 4-phosphate cytidylyltransferase [Bacteroidales bacterium]